MKFSENWLRACVDIPADRAGLVERLTMAGLEVEEASVIGEGVAGVVVAEIISAEPHPEADRLRVCQVDAGNGEILQIVCGAPNARAGLKAPLAKVGAVLPGGMQIKAAKLRGVESFGMLCSAKELNLPEGVDGLLELPSEAPIGQTITELLALPDAMLELKLTPNRSDCLGMLGLATELRALYGTALTAVEAPAVAATISTARKVELSALEQCPRYIGRVIEGVNAKASTPFWIAERLRRAGSRPISIIVDLTNYVMLELGQPMHAFDLDKIDGSINVRLAGQGEKLTLLDESEVELTPQFLLIADEKKALAVAGVMGGFDSRVTDDTSNLFLESAFFAPAAIMGRARKLGMHTDASHRFERGVDPTLCAVAIERLTALILQFAGGKAGPIIDSKSATHLPAAPTVNLRSARLDLVLGINVEPSVVSKILKDLGMQVTSMPDGWRVVPPSSRFDIAIEEDLIEEVARIYGYDQFPNKAPGGSLNVVGEPEAQIPIPIFKQALVNRGYCEAVCLSFVSNNLLKQWGMAGSAVALLNPLSADLAVMRPSLLPGLVKALAHNLDRQQLRVRLFEQAGVFDANKPGQEQRECLAGVAIGAAYQEQWSNASRNLDFFDIKGDVEQLLLRSTGATGYQFVATSVPFLHPGRSALIMRDDVNVGFVGALHPQLLAALDISKEVFVFELDMSTVSATLVPKASKLSKYPTVRRDISVVAKDTQDFAQIEQVIKASAGGFLRNILLFDEFRGESLPKYCKSLSMGLILQDDSRTLTDSDVDQVMQNVLKALAEKLAVVLRA